MIRNLLIGLAGWLAVSVSSLAATIVNNLSDVSYWVGSGQNQAVLIIDWQDGKVPPGVSGGQNLSLAWGFRWPAGETRTGEQMLLEIAAADPRLVVDLMYFGTQGLVFGIGYDLDGDGGTFTFDQWSEDGSASDPHDHFAEGLEENGFWGYKTGQSTGTRPVFSEPEGQNGFKLAAFDRVLSNGSWDAWVFSDNPSPPFPIPEVSPALAVVPEPSAALLLGAAGLAFAGRRRRAS